MNQKIDLLSFKNKNLHFVGIGGCSMSGLALICSKLDSMNFKITGSDKNDSPFVQTLIKSGIKVALTHDDANAKGADLIIYSAAIAKDNIERVYAQKNSIPQIERSDFLGEISKLFKHVVAISGCHGKTTITSMLAKIMIESSLEPNVHIGGYVDFLNGGVALGKSDLFVTEACEYVESFLSIEPTCILINNIDDDHLDYFKDMDAIVAAFQTFVNKLKNNDLLIGNIDDQNVSKILESYGGRKITYGFKQGDYQAKNIVNLSASDTAKTTFDCFLKDEFLCSVSLNIPGDYNVLNALAAIIVAREYGAKDERIVSSLSNYSLTKRRFEFYGTRNKIDYYHDYAHHPSEIKALLQGAKNVANTVTRNSQGKLFVVFQCNSYTRAKTLFSKDVFCFAQADEVLIPDIFPGREKDTGMVHARDMQTAIQKQGVCAKYLETFENIRDYLDKNATAGDLVLTIGSGDVYIQTKKLL